MLPVVPSEAAEFLCIHLFGWKWMSWIGRPTRDHPDYPIDNIRVRQFMSAEQLKMPSWKKWLADPKIEAREAIGDEPLTYTYCSSGCSAVPIPNFLGSADYAVLQQVKKRWKGKRWKRFESLLPSAANYKLGDYSKAAIIVLQGE